MQTVTAAFNTAATAVVRKPKARVTVIWTDPFIDSHIITPLQRNETCWPDQIADRVETVPHKWAHCDGTTPLSAGLYPMPGTWAEALDNQVGWWGADECDALGDFATAQICEIVFAPRPALTLRVVGDDAWGEYPVDFTVEIWTGPAGALREKIVTVTGNTDLVWTQDISADEITDCSKMILSITKWSTGSRVVKIVEFFTVISEVYDGDDIMSMSILEEAEVRDGSIPAGNISANEMDLALENVTDRFFSGNTAGSLYNLIKKNRKILPEL
jgi:hypothetical protein